MKKISINEGVLATIIGVTGGNLVLDIVRRKIDPMPKFRGLGEGTNLYVFTPSRGGGRALIRVKGKCVEVRRLAASPKQKDRIDAELATIFDQVRNSD